MMPTSRIVFKMSRFAIGAATQADTVPEPRIARQFGKGRELIARLLASYDPMGCAVQRCDVRHGAAVRRDARAAGVNGPGGRGPLADVANLPVPRFREARGRTRSRTSSRVTSSGCRAARCTGIEWRLTTLGVHVAPGFGCGGRGCAPPSRFPCLARAWPGRLGSSTRRSRQYGMGRKQQGGGGVREPLCALSRREFRDCRL